MVDVLTPTQRRLNMSRIRGKNTTPELCVRRMLRELQLTNYRLHAKHLPGKPDVVFPKLRHAIFVNGCYWHRHACAEGRVTPRTNTVFWLRKFDLTLQRDRICRKQLHGAGWSYLTIWECQLATPSAVRARLTRVLGNIHKSSSHVRARSVR